MRFSRTVRGTAKGIVDFIRREASRHPENSCDSYNVYMKPGSYMGIPTAEIRMVNKRLPRVESLGSFSINRFRPLYFPYAESRVSAAMDEAGRQLAKEGYQIFQITKDDLFGEDYQQTKNNKVA